MHRKWKIAAAILSISAWAPLSAEADLITPACKLDGMKARVFTTGTTYAPTETFKTIPATQVNFTAGAGSNCVVVQFSSVFIAAPDDILFLRAVIDDTIVGSPAMIRVAKPTFTAPYAFNFVFTNIAPGAHQAVMQWHVGKDSINIQVGPHTTIVQYTQ